MFMNLAFSVLFSSLRFVFVLFPIYRLVFNLNSLSLSLSLVLNLLHSVFEHCVCIINISRFMDSCYIYSSSIIDCMFYRLCIIYFVVVWILVQQTQYQVCTYQTLVSSLQCVVYILYTLCTLSSVLVIPTFVFRT